MNLREKKRPVDWPKQGLYFCLHHKIKCEYTYNIDERWDYQCAEKAYHELPVRLSAMRPVKGELPAELTLLCDKYYAASAKYDAAEAKVYAAQTQHHAALDKLDAARDKRNATRDKYYAARAKHEEVAAKRNAARDKYVAARDKRNATRDKYNAALIEYAPEIDALFAIECADVPWGDEGLIFQEEKE